MLSLQQRAQLHEHIAKLPQEYDTLIGERGLALSGGQRQRLNISRSLLLGTRILILDDSTSAVDAGTEKKIREALKEGTAERLTIIISHRVASLMHADQIVYMEDGKILERESRRTDETAGQLCAALSTTNPGLSDQMSQKALLWMNRYLTQDSLPPGAAAPPPEVSEEDMFGAGINHEVTKRFLGFMKPYRRWVIIAISALMIFTLTQILFPLIIQKALDGQLTYFENFDSLELGVLLFAGVVVINFTSHFFSEWMVSRVAQRLLFDMRRGMFEHLQKVSLSFMDKTETGRLMSRLQGDVGALQEFLEALVYAIGDLVLLIGIIFVLLAMDLRLGAMTLALMPVLMIIRVFWLPHARRAFTRARITSSIVTATMCENIRGIRVVQGMTRERVNRNLYETKANDHFRTTVKAAAIAQLMLPTVDTLTGLALGIIALVGGNLVLQGELTAGVMIAYILYVQRFFDPIRALTLHYNAFLRAMASGERIFEVLDVPVGIQDKPDAKEIGRSDGSVRFEKVTFGYNPKYPVLHDINLEIPAGQTIALVGPTGCGKSSIASLIHRFYDTYEGKVLVGGHDTRSLTQQSLSEQIAMVLQDPTCFQRRSWRTSATTNPLRQMKK